MPGKIEAIFQIRKSKVTYAAEKKSDGGVARVKDHHCVGGMLSGPKRYIRFWSLGSPMAQKSKAIFRFPEHGVTYAAEKKSDGGAA